VYQFKGFLDQIAFPEQELLYVDNGKEF